MAKIENRSDIAPDRHFNHDTRVERMLGDLNEITRPLIRKIGHKGLEKIAGINLEIARSNFNKMGKSKACYSALHEITSIYKKLLK